MYRSRWRRSSRTARCSGRVCPPSSEPPAEPVPEGPRYPRRRAVPLSPRPRPWPACRHPGPRPGTPGRSPAAAPGITGPSPARCSRRLVAPRATGWPAPTWAPLRPGPPRLPAGRRRRRAPSMRVELGARELFSSPVLRRVACACSMHEATSAGQLLRGPETPLRLSNARRPCSLSWLVHPLGLGCDPGLRVRSRAVEARGAHSHQDPNAHVVVAEGLAREPDLPEQIPALEHLELGPGHLLGLTLKVLDAARGALGVGTAAMQDVHPGIFFDRKDQPLVFGDVEGPYALDLEIRHWPLLPQIFARPYQIATRGGSPQPGADSLNFPPRRERGLRLDHGPPS